MLNYVRVTRFAVEERRAGLPLHSEVLQFHAWVASNLSQIFRGDRTDRAKPVFDPDMSQTGREIRSASSAGTYSPMELVMSSRAIHRVALWALAFGIFSISNVSAGQLIGTVGPLPACQWGRIQDAIDNHMDEIHVMTGTYAPFEISGKVIEIDGGYADCNASAPTPGAMSEVSGAGFTRKSVIYVRPGSNNNTILNLHNLQITSGNAFNGSNGNGGGISFHGHGELDLTHVNVINNYADNGGGIDVDPDGPATGLLFPDGKTVVHLSGSYIANNKTAFDGAGIRIQGPTHLKILKDALSDAMSIAYNSAGVDALGNLVNDTATGGGLLLKGGEARANISSTSTNSSIGLISHNQAGYGGGIAVENAGAVRIFTTVPTELVGIDSNFARRAGGGIHMGGSESRVCAFGYRIDINSAQNGAAVYSDTDAKGILFEYSTLFNNGSSYECSPEYAPSPQYNEVYPTIPNEIEGNTATQDDGAIVLMQNTSRGFIRAEYVKVQYNSGGSALRIFPSGSVNSINNCLIANNQVRHELINSESAFSIDSCTLANNAISASDVIRAGYIGLRRSIFWQPGKRTLNHVGSEPQIFSDSIANDASDYPQNNLSFTDPLFVSTSPFQENYRLSLNSPAVDYAGTGLNIDMDHHDRGIVQHGDASRRFDIGAYERQTAAPLVTFPTDENFDELNGPEQPRGLLPVNWTTSFSGAGAAWTTTGSGNGLAATTGDPDSDGESSLRTPIFTLFSPARLSFDQLTSLETNYDGAVLEIAMGGEAFVDIVEAGGQFLAGDYNATIRNDTLNPIADRRAWTGDSGDFQQVIVTLPAAANGRSVQLRWRVGTDNSNFMCDCYGYWIDNIHVDLGDPADTVFANGFEDPPAN